MLTMYRNKRAFHIDAEKELYSSCVYIQLIKGVQPILSHQHGSVG